MKFVCPLSEVEEKELKKHQRNNSSFRVQQRSHAILLSAAGYSMNQLADVFNVHRDTISRWLKNWEQSRLTSLSDALRPGRPKKLSESKEARALEIILEEPRQPKAAIPKIKTKFDITVSVDWVKRLLKKTITAGNECENLLNLKERPMSTKKK